MNSITISGNVCRDAKKIETKTGTEMSAFTVAVRRTDKITDFFDCISLGKQAEMCNKWVKKGTKVIVQGEMRCEVKEETRRWNLFVGKIEFTGKVESTTDLSNDDSVKEVETKSEDLPF